MFIHYEIDSHCSLHNVELFRILGCKRMNKSCFLFFVNVSTPFCSELKDFHPSGGGVRVHLLVTVLVGGGLGRAEGSPLI